MTNRVREEGQDSDPECRQKDGTSRERELTRAQVAEKDNQPRTHRQRGNIAHYAGLTDLKMKKKVSREASGFGQAGAKDIVLHSKGPRGEAEVRQDAEV